jgi:acetyl esterase/lipase
VARARRTLVAALGLAVAATLPSFAAPAKPKAPAFGHEKAHGPRDLRGTCSGNPSTYQLLRYPSGGQTAQALYVLPAGKPRGVVVFDHGYSHTMYSWVRHLQRTARTLGVIAVAPDYRGQHNDLRAKPLPSSRGWRVSAGAVDTNAVAALFDRACLKGKGHNVLYSVSMGGNTAGLALAQQPKRLNGAPLFDQWVDVEGEANVSETYAGAAALAAANTFAAHAVADIEEETGGTPLTVPQAYADRTVVLHSSEIAGSGIKGVVMVHGVADGLVTHDISRQLQLELLAQGVPVDFTAFLTHSKNSEPGTTLDGYLPTGQTSPFAGHASETSETHDVGRTGFAKLAGLYRGEFFCGDRLIDPGTQSDTGVIATCP